MIDTHGLPSDVCNRRLTFSGSPDIQAENDGEASRLFSVIANSIRSLEGKNASNYEVFNLGTGKGSSVLEVINSFEKVSGKKLNYKIVGRRQGDIVSAYADTTKANEVLGWKAMSSLDEAMKSAWDWEQKIRD